MIEVLSSMSGLGTGVFLCPFSCIKVTSKILAMDHILVHKAFKNLREYFTFLVISHFTDSYLVQVKVHQWQCFLHPHVPPSSEPEQKKQQIPAPARISCRLMACLLIYRSSGFGTHYFGYSYCRRTTVLWLCGTRAAEAYKQCTNPNSTAFVVWYIFFGHLINY